MELISDYMRDDTYRHKQEYISFQYKYRLTASAAALSSH